MATGLVCVRYRYDEQARKRFKTVELIVEEVDWEPRARRMAGDAIVRVVPSQSGMRAAI